MYINVDGTHVINNSRSREMQIGRSQRRGFLEASSVASSAARLCCRAAAAKAAGTAADATGAAGLAAICPHFDLRTRGASVAADGATARFAGGAAAVDAEWSKTRTRVMDPSALTVATEVPAELEDADGAAAAEATAAEAAAGGTKSIEVRVARRAAVCNGTEKQRICKHPKQSDVSERARAYNRTQQALPISFLHALIVRACCMS